MLVDPNLKNDEHDAASRQDKSIAMLDLSPRGKFGLLIAAAVLCFGVYWLLVASPSHYRAGELVEKAATVVRTGDRVTVPEGSPVRSRLVIEPVAVKDIKRDIVLPAVVEADPSRDRKSVV
jgi:membrane fusion protein, heavy metal efflux system